MMKLSDNFWLSEFQRSMTAVRLGINNQIPIEMVPNLRHLTQHSLQPLRRVYGKPIRVASGFRSSALNSFIGGAVGSQHQKGEAADVDTVEDNLMLFQMILDNKLPFDQLIWEFGDEHPEWIHISCRREENRGEILRAYRDKYGTHYSPYKKT